MQLMNVTFFNKFMNHRFQYFLRLIQTLGKDAIHFDNSVVVDRICSMPTIWKYHKKISPYQR